MSDGLPIPLPNTKEAITVATAPIDPTVSSRELFDIPTQRGAQSIGEKALTDLVAENATLRRELAERDAQLAEYKRQLDNALTDPLMNVAARAKFETFVNNLENGTTSIDLDNNHVFFGVVDVNLLKRVNDEKGHSMGDEVLALTSEGIVQAITEEKILGSIRHADRATEHTGQDDDNRQKDIVFRIGGDEIALVLVIPKYIEKPPEKIITEIRTRIEENISNGIISSPILSDDVKSYAGRVSMGFEKYNPGDAVADVIHRADRAMYVEKKRSKRPPHLTSSIGGIIIDTQVEPLID